MKLYTTSQFNGGMGAEMRVHGRYFVRTNGAVSGTADSGLRVFFDSLFKDIFQVLVHGASSLEAAYFVVNLTIA